MRFLLAAVNSKYIHTNPAIYSLKAYAQAAGMPDGAEVVLAQYTINEPIEGILQGIYREKPDVIGFSCYIWNISIIRQLAGDLSRILPHVPIWLGGPEVSHEPETVLQEMPGVTGIMTGEGEESFWRLLSFYSGAGKIQDVPGIVWRMNGRGTPERDEEQHTDEIRGITESGTEQVMRQGAVSLPDFSAMPFPYEHLEDFANRIIYYESSRGCPYRCSYCLSSIDRKVRFRSLELVYRELDFFLTHKVKQVKFVDRTFNARPARSLAIWQYLTEHDNGITNFHFEISGELLTEEELFLFEKMRPGLIQLEIGVQTTNPETLQGISRHASFEKIAEAVKRVKSTGKVHQHLDLIAGLPYEDYESFGHSFDQVYGLKPDQLQLGFLKVLKGSPLYEKAGEYGIVYRAYPPYEVLFTKWLSYDDMLRLKAVEEVVELYYNSGQFQTAIGYLEQFFARPFELYEALGDFCEREKKGYEAHSRIRQYERLLAFGETIPAADRQVLICALVHDCYLRENCKSRPSFAPAEGIPEKEAVRSFYQREGEKPLYLTSYISYNSRQMANMTHLERYPVNVFLLRQGQVVYEPVTVLYDYAVRDTFHHDGAAWQVTL